MIVVVVMTSPYNDSRSKVKVLFDDVEQFSVGLCTRAIGVNVE